MSDTSPVDPQPVSPHPSESIAPQIVANETKRRPGRPRKPPSDDPEVMEKRLAGRVNRGKYYLTYIEKLKREGRYEAWAKRRTEYMRDYQRRKRAMSRAERTVAARAVLQSLQPVEGQHAPLSEVRVPGVQERTGVEPEVTPEITLGDLFG